MFQSTFPRRERLKGSFFIYSSLLFQSTFPRRERHICNKAKCPFSCFNPRSREGNDIEALKSAYDEHTFQSTFPRRERLKIGSKAWQQRGFNPRSREGNDFIHGIGGGMHNMFQSTFPRRERPWRLRRASCLEEFQSTFPRRERHKKRGYEVFWIRFQSTFPRRERPWRLRRASCLEEFQSTFPRRERQLLRTFRTKPLPVSIHVPAKGTTTRSPAVLKPDSGFNPRSREGNDQSSLSPVSADPMFQSTFPRRERPMTAASTVGEL